MARCVLHTDLDAFFVSVEQALNPELKGKPMVVGGHPNRRGVVASASYKARTFGIQAGMPLTAARRLCPQAIFLQGNPSRYRDASVKFMDILADFSPSLEPVGIDEAYLDATGCEPIYGTPQQLALKIKECIKNEINLTASVGVASCKVVAKIASDLCKPDGLLQVTTGQEAIFLAPLPIAKLPGVGRKTEQALKEMGITTIGNLATLPLEVAKRYFGAAGITIHNYANGIDNRKVQTPSEAKSVSREITFAQDTVDAHFLKAVLHYLCERVGSELRHQDRQTKCLTLKLRYADFETTTRRLSLREAADADQIIFAMALQLLDKTLAQKRKLVRLIGIEVSNLSTEGKQLHMFDPARQRLEYLNKAIDRIRRRYGFASIQSGWTLSLKELLPETKLEPRPLK